MFGFGDRKIELCLPNGKGYIAFCCLRTFVPKSNPVLVDETHISVCRKYLNSVIKELISMNMSIIYSRYGKPMYYRSKYERTDEEVF